MTTITQEQLLLQDLAPGDRAYILNSRQNGIHEVTVDTVGDQFIVVIKNGERQVFRLDNGEAHAPGVQFFHGKPTLLHPADWRAQVLITRGRFRQMTVNVQQKMTDFSDNPTQATGDALLTFVRSWVAFASTADRHALTAESIPDYEEVSKA